jgi:hypothetical protein
MSAYQNMVNKQLKTQNFRLHFEYRVLRYSQKWFHFHKLVIYKADLYERMTQKRRGNGEQIIANREQ